jgi:hypothetical protein
LSGSSLQVLAFASGSRSSSRASCKEESGVNISSLGKVCIIHLKFILKIFPLGKVSIIYLELILNYYLVKHGLFSWQQLLG